MKKSAKTTRFGWDQVKDFCETLTEAEEALAVAMVSRISDKWSLWTMSVTAELGQPMRFSRIMDMTVQLVIEDACARNASAFRSSRKAFASGADPRVAAPAF